MAEKKFNESDLFPPLKEYLENHGYTVRAEVNSCDVTAIKDDDLIIIELKKTCSIDLLLQASERQALSDSVYICIPTPPKGMANKRWRALQRLLKKLELGVILITFGKLAPRVDVLFHPLPYRQPRQNKKQRAILEEMAGRSANYNQGGVVRQKLITAYRENALHIACALQVHGRSSAKFLRSLEPSTGEKTHAILYKNVYGWFSRVGQGQYDLTAAGHEAINTYPQVTTAYLEKLTPPES